MNAMNPVDVKRTMTLEELGAMTDLNMLKVISVDELWGFGAERGRHAAKKSSRRMLGLSIGRESTDASL